MPPLAKFAAAPFGIVERFAEPDGIAMLPVTLRNVEAALATKGLKVEQTKVTVPADAGKVSTFTPSTDADIIKWFLKVQRYDNFTVSRKIAARDVKGPLPKPIDDYDKDQVQSRMLSLLGGQADVKTLDLPKPASNSREAKAIRRKKSDPGARKPRKSDRSCSTIRPATLL